MGTAQVTFAVVLYGGATGSHVPCTEVCSAHAQYPLLWGLLTGSDASHVTSGRGHVQKYVLRMPGFSPRAFFLVVIQ